MLPAREAPCPTGQARDSDAPAVEAIGLNGPYEFVDAKIFGNITI
jgi:hypothetical protein